MADDKLIYLFRHGETDWNKGGRLQGGADIPLNLTGREQAESLFHFFNRHPVEAFFCSDLSRVRETTAIANRETAVPEFFDVRLRETNLGQAEGIRAEEIDEKFGAGSLEAWRQSGPGSQDFHFPEGETKSEHLARTLCALEEFVGKTVYRVFGVGSHGGTIRRLIHHFNPELSSPAMIPNCAVYRLTVGIVWQLDPRPVGL